MHILSKMHRLHMLKNSTAPAYALACKSKVMDCRTLHGMLCQGSRIQDATMVHSHTLELLYTTMLSRSTLPLATYLRASTLEAERPRPAHHTGARHPAWSRQENWQSATKNRPLPDMHLYGTEHAAHYEYSGTGRTQI